MPGLFEKVTWEFGQLSVTVVIKLLTTALHAEEPVCTVITFGHEMLGLTLSATITRKEQVFLLPLASTACATTELLPTGNNVFWSREKVILGSGQLSSTVVLKSFVLAPQISVPVDRLIPPVGHRIVGLTLSLTMTGYVQILSLPVASVAFAVTRVLPRGKREPDFGE